MKKLITLALIGLTFIACSKANRSNLYPDAGIVTGVDRETDTVTWTDGYHDWCFEGTEDWMVGDGIAAIMDDNGTEIVTDDVIVSIRYIG